VSNVAYESAKRAFAKYWDKVEDSEEISDVKSEDDDRPAYLLFYQEYRFLFKTHMGRKPWRQD